MSVLVGTLAVDVVNGQATFTLDDAKSKLDDFGKKVKDTQETVDYSMREARESITMTGEAFGVRLPAGISRAIASIGPLGPALEAAFPLVAVAAGVALLIEHIKKVKEAQEEVTKVFATQSRTIGEHSDELRLSIAKDTAELNKLLGKPNTNGAAISLAEARVEANKLYDSLKKDNDELVKTLENSSRGIVMSFLPGQSQGAAQARDVAKGFGDALAAIPHDSNYEANVQKATVAAWQRAQYEINKDKQDMQDNSGKNLSKDIEELQKLQVHLSEIHDEYQLIGKDDSLKKSIEAAKVAASEVIHVKPPDWKAYEESVKKKKEQEEKLQEEQIAAGDAFTKAMKKQQGDREQIANMDAEQSAHQSKAGVESQIYKLDDQRKLGLVGLRQYVSQKIDLLNKEEAAELSYLNFKKQMAEADFKKAVDNGDLTAEIEAKKQLIQATNQLDEAQNKYQHEIDATRDSVEKLDTTWKTYFKNLDTQLHDMPNAAKVMQTSMTQAMDGFSQSFAKTIVEGKNLGQQMRQVAAHILESWIEMAMKRLIMDELVTAAHIAGNAEGAASDKMTAMQSQLSYAKAAAAKAYSAMAGIPYIGPALGAAAAVSAFTLLMAFEKGGIVPGYGMGDSVPAKLTPGEMVLPKPISQGLQGAIQNGGIGGSTHIQGGDVHIHAQALDSTGMDRVLKKNSKAIQKKFHNEVRRRGK